MLRLLARKRWLAVAAPFVLLLVVLSFTLSSQAAVARSADRPNVGMSFFGTGWFKDNKNNQFYMTLYFTKVTESNTIEAQLAEAKFGDEIVKVVGSITNPTGDANNIEFESVEVIRPPAQGKGMCMGCRYTATMLVGVGGYTLTGKWYWPGVIPNGDSNKAGDFYLQEQK